MALKWAVGPCRSAQPGGLHFVNGFDFFYASPLLAEDLATENIQRTRERQAVLSLLADTVRQEVDLAVAETHPTLHDVRPFLHRGWTSPRNTCTCRT